MNDIEKLINDLKYYAMTASPDLPEVFQKAADTMSKMNAVVDAGREIEPIGDGLTDNMPINRLKSAIAELDKDEDLPVIYIDHTAQPGGYGTEERPYKSFAEVLAWQFHKTGTNIKFRAGHIEPDPEETLNDGVFQAYDKADK